MTILAPIMRLRQINNNKELTRSSSDVSHKRSGGTSRTSSSSTIQSTSPDDPVLGSIRGALSRWRTLWVSLRTRIPADEWAAMGFMKTAYNFWQVANLLIAKKHTVDVIMQMEVKCEDKLERLKVLLQDDND